MSEHVGDFSDETALKHAFGQFDVYGRAGRFIERTQLLTEYASRELGAYRLFCSIVRVFDGQAEYSVNELTGVIDIDYPPIDYQPDPSDSDTHRQIELQQKVLVSNGVQAVVPWLRVFTLPVVEMYGLDTEHAEECFARTDLEVICGRRKEHGDALFEPMLEHANPGNSGRLELMFGEQTDYIGWLQKAAVALGVPPNVYTNLVIPEGSRCQFG